MKRRIAFWVLIGITVACCWGVVGLLVGSAYNLGRSTIVAMTAPASVLGRRGPLGMVSFILLNGGMYGAVGITTELARRLYHFRELPRM